MRAKLTSLVCPTLVLLFASWPGSAGAQEARWLRYPAISPDGQTIVFSYRGDLWSVPATGGDATPLTLHEADDTRPVWSPDGTKIAFASDRYGNFDVWVMPARGGEPTRLTYDSADDYPTAFTADGSAVLFSSARLDSVSNVQFPTRAQPELYEASLGGGMPRQVLSTPALYAAPDGTGTRIAYSDRKGYENEWRKHDDSAFARDVWIYDVATGTHTRLTEFGHDDRQPVWGPGDQTLYFLSERSGSFNVWRMDLAGLPAAGEEGSASTEGEVPVEQAGTAPVILAATAVTSHEIHPVRFLSASSAGDLAYAWDGDLYLRPAGATESRKLAVRVAADRRVNAVQHIDVASGITEFDVSPDGKEIAFIARGEVFVTSTDHAETRRITDTPGQERSVSFSPDGRSLLYASERGESWNLYRTDLADEEEPNFFNATALAERPVLETDAEAFQPSWSPDGKEVAYLKERTELEVVNLDSGETRTILPGEVNYSYSDGDQWYEWSPDGQNFLVHYMSPGRWSFEAGLVPASGEGELVDLTRSGYEDFNPRWALGGEAMFWFSDRYGSRLEAGWPSQFDVRLAFFTQKAWDRYHLSEAELEQLKAKEDEEKKDEEKKAAEESETSKKKDKKSKEAEAKDEGPKLPEPVALDLDRLEDRIIRLTTHSADMVDAALTPDGETLLYLARFEKGYDLWSYSHRKEEIKLLAKLDGEEVGGLELDAEGKKAFLLVDHSLRTVDVDSGEAKPVALSADFELDAAGERGYLFEHVWRQTLKKFHDVDMHGVDWAFYKGEYAKFLPYVATNRDFCELLSEMLGELDASHTGCYYRPDHPQADETAALGFFPDPEWGEAGIRIAEILPRSPLLQDGSKIEVGTVIEAIDGEEIGAGENWYPLLNRKAGKPTRLSLRDPASGKTWDEKVKPIGLDEERELLYQRWEESRRAEVDRLSGGRLGYTHIRSMSDRSYREIFEDIFGDSLDKEAIILDTRFNGGGNLDEALTVLLSGKVFMRARPRGREVGAVPEYRWTRPSIIIQNEGNYSDGHCVPNGYRTLGLGKTVGMQVPGTCTAVWWERLQDRSLVFGIPEVTWLDNEGDAMENKHFEPDYEVDNDPRLEASGRDQQLEKAVEVLLAELDAGS